MFQRAKEKKESAPPKETLSDSLKLRQNLASKLGVCDHEFSYGKFFVFF